MVKSRPLRALLLIGILSIVLYGINYYLPETEIAAYLNFFIIGPLILPGIFVDLMFQTLIKRDVYGWSIFVELLGNTLCWWILYLAIKRVTTNPHPLNVRQVKHRSPAYRQTGIKIWVLNLCVDVQ